VAMATLFICLSGQLPGAKIQLSRLTHESRQVCLEKKNFSKIKKNTKIKVDVLACVFLINVSKECIIKNSFFPSNLLHISLLIREEKEEEGGKKKKKRKKKKNTVFSYLLRNVCI